MRLIRAHLDYITSTINDIDTMLNSLIAPYENAVQLLCTIPGVDRNSAITVISEIGTDMTPFSNSKRLCCWAGLTPDNNESAGKKKSVRITRAGVYLKPALVQVAHAAVKSDKSPYYKQKYERIMKRRGKKRAIIAIARMILTAIYQMLSTGEAWNPTDLFKIDMPEPMKEKQKEKAIKQAMKLLIREGKISESHLASLLFKTIVFFCAAIRQLIKVRHLLAVLYFLSQYPLVCCYRDLYVDELQTELGKCCIYFSESVPPDIALP